MIPVPNPIEEPATFDVRCRQAGAQWLIRNPDKKRPYSYWRQFNLDLRRGFSSRCAYQGFFIAEGHVDHFHAWVNDKSLAYEWSNYRYSTGWLNSSKNGKPTDQLVDPFENCAGWFEIILPSLQMVITENVPEEHRQRAEDSLTAYCLRDDERSITVRRSYMEMYEQGDLTLVGLDSWFPLLAKAIRKRDGLPE